MWAFIIGRTEKPVLVEIVVTMVIRIYKTQRIVGRNNKFFFIFEYNIGYLSLIFNYDQVCLYC